METSKIIIACQGAGREPFTKEAEYLFKSLNAFGGKLKNANKIACFSEPISTGLIQNFANLGVKVKIVEKLDRNFSYANKIQMLRLVQEEDLDFLVALDTDIVIANDFSNFIDEGRIGATLDGIDPLGMEKWKNLFEYFGLQLPSETYLTTYTARKTIPYFNSAVLFIPRIYASKLYESWKSFVEKLSSVYDNFSDITEYAYYTDQIALSLAFQHTKLPYYQLPPEMNFHTHIGIHKNCKTDRVLPFQLRYNNIVSKLKPFLIHYHHRVTESGYIRYCYYENINRVIDRINLSLNTIKMDSEYNNMSEEQLKQLIVDPETIVDELYIEILRRPADKGGLRHFSSLLLNKKMTIEDIRNALLNSDEYRALLTSDKMDSEYNNMSEEQLKQLELRINSETIVDELYIEILRRPADKGGLRHFSSLLLNKKMTIEDIRNALLNSDEYRALLISS